MIPAQKEKNHALKKAVKKEIITKVEAMIKEELAEKNIE